MQISPDNSPKQSPVMLTAESSPEISSMSDRRKLSSADEHNSAKSSLSTKHYYPNDLMHGILAAHCADETGSIAGQSKVKAGDKVIFSKDNSLHQHLLRNNQLDMNEYAKGWKALKVIDHKDTGYLGIIYCNDEANQLVLTHRSTNFKLAFTKANVTKGSGMQADLDSVVMGMITTHQGGGYIATKKAIELVTNKKFGYSDYSLSTTGHSLGSWLAQLSTFYAATDFKYNLKSVDFDGPGSREMIEMLLDNRIDKKKIKIENLDITSYLSAPNIVNCSNKHLGEVYRVYADIANDHNMIQSFLRWIGKEAAFNTLFGHDLIYIIPQFDKDTGRPIKYDKVEKWPSITYKSFGNEGKETTSLFALIRLGKIMVSGKMNQQQFWLTHEHLDKDDKYVPKPETIEHEIESFKLSYMGNYEVKDVDLYKRYVKGSIDKKLVKFKEKLAPKILRMLHTCPSVELSRLMSFIKDMTQKYSVQEHLDAKEIIVDSRYSTTIMDLRGATRCIFHRYGDSYTELISITLASITNLASELPLHSIQNYIEPRGIFKKIDEALQLNKSAVITGFSGTGKSSCALQYAYRLKDEGALVRWFDSSSKEKLFAEYKDFAESIRIDLGKNQKVLINIVNGELSRYGKRILLIFDNVENNADINDFILNLPNNVSIIITPKNSELSLVTKNQIIELEPFSKNEAIKYMNEVSDLKITQDQKAMLVQKFSIALNVGGSLISPLRLSITVSYLEEKLKYLDDVSDKEFSQLIEGFDNIEKLSNTILQSIKQEDLKTWELLQYIQQLDPDFITINFVKELIGQEENIWRNSVQKLTNLSLAKVVRKDNSVGLRVHRLVQDDIRRCGLEKLPKDKITNNLLEALNKLLPTVTDVPNKDWQLATNLLISMTAVLKKENDKEINDQLHAQLYDKIGSYHQHVLNDHGKSLEYYKKAYVIYKSIHSDENHENLVTSLHNLGLAFRGLGKGQEAVENLKNALDMQLILDPKSMEAAELYNDYAYVYFEQINNRPPENLDNIKKVLDDLKQAFDIHNSLGQSESDDTASVLINRASVKQCLYKATNQALNVASMNLEILINSVGTAANLEGLLKDEEIKDSEKKYNSQGKLLIVD